MTDSLFPEETQDVDVDRLHNDPEYAWDHIREFIGFTDRDYDFIQQTEPYLREHLRGIVVEFYDRLLDYEPTAKLYRNDKEEWDRELYEHRVHGFVLWLERIFDWPRDQKYVEYIRDVGEIHSGSKGFAEMVVDRTYLGPSFTILLDEISQHLLREEDVTKKDLSDYLTAWQRFFRIQEHVMNIGYD
ncbi:MAG: protoglobin family protein [bacterium]